MNVKLKEKTKTTTLITLLFSGIVISLLFGWLLSTFGHDWRFVNEPLHSTLETFGAFIAITMSVILLERNKKEYKDKLFFLAMGFLSMALLDGFHAISPQGNGFVFLHGMSSLSGSFCFALIFLKVQTFNDFLTQKKWIPWIVVIGSISLAIWTFFFEETLPVMLHKGQFTSFAVVINFLAGMFFIAAAGRLLLDFCQSHMVDIYFFASIAFFFGLAELPFSYSVIWSFNWWWWHVLRLIASLLGLVILHNERRRIISDLEITLEKLRNLSSHLQYAIEEERTWIAREIHDELGQLLTALQNDLSYLTLKLPADKKQLIKKTETMYEYIDMCIQTVQKISSDLRPSLLDKLGVIPAMKRHAKEFQARTEIKCVVTFNTEDLILDKDCSTMIFRIFQEALTNIARHANATIAKVNLTKETNKLILSVKDNGQGITADKVSSTKSFGIIGMRERVRFMGGELDIDGVKGTSLIVTIPFP